MGVVKLIMKQEGGSETSMDIPLHYVLCVNQRRQYICVFPGYSFPMMRSVDGLVCVFGLGFEGGMRCVSRGITTEFLRKTLPKSQSL